MNHNPSEDSAVFRSHATDPVDALLKQADWARLARPGLFQPRPVIIRTFWPEARVLGTGTLVGENGPRWVVLTDFPLDPGMGLTVGQVLEELGTLAHFVCEVQTCHPGQRPEDAGRDVFISRLECRRGDQQG